MPKSRTKRKSTFLVLVLTFIGLVTASFNILLIQSKDIIIETVNELFYHELSVGKVYYMFPNIIVAKELALSQANTAPRKELLVLPKMVMKFSLGQLIFQRAFVIDRLAVVAPRVDDARSYEHIKAEMPKILYLISKMPRTDMRFNIKRAKLNTGDKSLHPKYITSDFSFNIKKNSIFGSGFVSPGEDIYSSQDERQISYSKKGVPLRYRYSAFFTQGGFFLKELEVSWDEFYLKLWGDSHHGQFRLKGYAFLNDPLKDGELYGTTSDFLGYINNTMAQQVNDGRFKKASRIKHYIFDIDSAFEITPDQIRIDHLGFIVDGTPVHSKGSIALNSNLDFELLFSGYPSYSKITKLKGIKKADLYVKGYLKKGVVDTDGKLDLYLGEIMKTGIPLERIEVNFKNLSSNFQDYPKIGVHLKEGHLFCCTDDVKHSVYLKNFHALVNLYNEHYQFVDFQSPFYDGYFKGRLGVNSGAVAPKITSSVSFGDVNVNKLGTLLPQFSKVKGKFTGQLFARNYPDYDLQAMVSVKDGQLNDFEFLGWLAEYFDIASLKRIDFHDMSVNFAMNPGQAGLQRVRLRSDDVNIDGFFQLAHDNLVSSKFSLAFSRELMQESPHLKPLMKRIKKDIDPLEFDFQISGELDSLNFEWAQSDLKEQIQDKIPGFIQRRIERHIESSI